MSSKAALDSGDAAVRISCKFEVGNAEGTTDGILDGTSDGLDVGNVVNAGESRVNTIARTIVTTITTKQIAQPIHRFLMQASFSSKISKRSNA